MILRALFSFSIVSFTLMFASLLGATPLNQSYYKNPGWDAFLAASDEMIQEIADTKDAHELQHALNKASIFIAHVLNQKPEQLNDMLKNFSDFPLNKKTVYLRAIQSVGLEHELLTHLLDKELEEKVSSSPLLSLSGLNPLLIKQGNEIDYLWVSFFATGQTSYIRQVLENLNRDERLLVLAWNVFSKHLDSAQTEEESYFKDIITTTFDLNAAEQRQFLIASNALFSLTSHSGEDTYIQEMIQKMMEEDDSLNFLKKVHS